MPEENLTIRRCNICKISKTLTEFSVTRRFPLGRSYRCKSCDASISRAYQRANPQAHRARSAEYRKLHPEAYRAYQRSPGYKAAWEKYKTKFPERFKARQALTDAVKAGKLIRPDICSQCGQQRKTEAHHHFGYTPEHWLDVIWLCKRCHHIADRKFP